MERCSVHVAWVWEPASKETFWGGMETKAVKRYQTNVKIESLGTPYIAKFDGFNLKTENYVSDQMESAANILFE
jgi:hypothetical protein